jgi:hypothetical protein
MIALASPRLCGRPWNGVESPCGEIRDSTVPASTFYHLAGAIAAMTLAPAG